MPKNVFHGKCFQSKIFILIWLSLTVKFVIFYISHFAFVQIRIYEIKSKLSNYIWKRDITSSRLNKHQSNILRRRHSVSPLKQRGYIFVQLRYISTPCKLQYIFVSFYSENIYKILFCLLLPSVYSCLVLQLNPKY